MQVLQFGGSLKPVRVLVADDDPVLRSLVRANLEGRVDEIVEAGDGQEAWELILTQPFGLGLIDLSMPGLDGFALIRCIRGHPRTRHLPIVVITSSNDQAAVRLALDAGATAFLTKPINWSLFSHQIDYLVRINQCSAVDRATRQRAEAVARAKDAVIAALAARVREQSRRLVTASEMEMRRHEATDGRGLDYAATVLADARAIEEVLDELLPYFRSMTEQIVVDDRPASVVRLVEACVERHADIARIADVRIWVGQIPATLRVCCDEMAIGRALGSLLRNAIEFTASGSTVRIGVELKEDGALAIMIDDEGPGVDPEKIARYLQPLDIRSEGQLKGADQAALGLPVAKAIANAHGGTVELVSRSSGGTRAYLFLPADIVEAGLEEVA